MSVSVNQQRTLHIALKTQHVRFCFLILVREKCSNGYGAVRTFRVSARINIIDEFLVKTGIQKRYMADGAPYPGTIAYDLARFGSLMPMPLAPCS